MSESGNSAGSTRAMVPFTNDPSSTHNTTRANFKCPVPRCGRTFVHHYDLRSHIRTHSQGNSPQPSSSLLSIRSTPESSGYQSDTGSQEGAHRRGQRRAIEGPRLSSLSQSGDIQFESQSSISDVWPQQTTHPAPYMAALSLSEPGTANPTPLRNTSPASQHDTEGESGEAFGAASLPLEISSSSDRGLGHGNTEPESEARHISQGTKRRLEDDHEPNNEEEGGKPKRGKVIHRDYADVLSDQVESFSPKEYSIEDATQSVEADDPTSDARLTVKIQTGQLSCEEMFRCLVAHGCADLSSEMDPKQYSAGLIQGGAFGDIWKGKLHDGTEVAIKVWRFSSLIANNSKSLKRAMREIYHWSKVKHEYVQELMGVIMFQGRLGMVSRWMNNGNLREHIHKSPGADRYALCIQVATGIAHLHNRELEMVHGDLKGTNILVSSEGVAKLSDFDHSIMSECSLAFSDTSKPGGGTTRWMAPELVLDENCCRSTFTDVYALGMTMLEIITGTSPYYPQCKDDVGVIKAIMTKTLPVRPMDHLGDNSRDNQMWELLLRCWKYDPLARPKAAEVVKSLNAIIALPATGNPV